MKDVIRRLDAEYGFGLTEEEVELIAKMAEETNRQLERLYEVDLTGVMPYMKVDPKSEP